MMRTSPLRTVSPLAHLVQDGVLVRASGRLRVSPRFLAQAERAALQATLVGAPGGVRAALERALRAHGYGGDAGVAARYLEEFMAERGQMGMMQPVFGVRTPFVTG
jgi:hypothetical protein